MEKLRIEADDFNTLAKMLRKVDFFASLTVGQLELVLPYIQLYSCAPKETIFRQGDKADAFYVVYTGEVEVRLKKGFFAAVKPISHLGPGDIFGEMALLSNNPRSATVVSTEPTRLFVLLAQDFHEIIEQNNNFAVAMKKIAAGRKFASEHSS